MSEPKVLQPFQPTTMSSAHLAAVSFLACYAGRTHQLYEYQLKEWFSWCDSNALDPLVGVQRAHIELYIREAHRTRSHYVGHVTTELSLWGGLARTRPTTAMNTDVGPNGKWSPIQKRPQVKVIVVLGLVMTFLLAGCARGTRLQPAPQSSRARPPRRRRPHP